MNVLTEAIHNYKPDESQRLALLTWYQSSDPRYLEPRHPLIKLAGEAGELLDLFGKHEYKPEFDWWDCKKCGMSESKPIHTKHWVEDYHVTIPKVLDELGDWWYYYRIVSFIYGKPISYLNRECYYNWDIDKLLGLMAQNSAVMLNDWLDKKQIDGSRLKVLWGCFAPLLDKLDCTLDRLTELNYQKLNSEPSAHGWKNV